MRPPRITVIFRPDRSVTLSDGKQASATFDDPDTVDAILDQAIEALEAASFERTTWFLLVVGIAMLLTGLCAWFVF